MSRGRSRFPRTRRLHAERKQSLAGRPRRPSAWRASAETGRRRQIGGYSRHGIRHAIEGHGAETRAPDQPGGDGQGPSRGRWPGAPHDVQPLAARRYRSALPVSPGEHVHGDGGQPFRRSLAVPGIQQLMMDFHRISRRPLHVRPADRPQRRSLSRFFASSPVHRGSRPHLPVSTAPLHSGSPHILHVGGLSVGPGDGCMIRSPSRQRRAKARHRRRIVRINARAGGPGAPPTRARPGVGFDPPLTPIARARPGSR